MTDWNFVAAVVTILTLVVALVVGGAVKFLHSIHRSFQLRHRSTSHCDTLYWHDLPPSNPSLITVVSSSALHKCQYLCRDHRHNPGPKCFESTMRTTFNLHYFQTIRRLSIAKPERLLNADNGRGLRGYYMKSDYWFVMAFIFCASRSPSVAMTALERPADYEFADVRISVDHKLSEPVTNDHKRGQIVSRMLVLHIDGAFQRHLTRVEIERLIKGYPPFYREILELRPGGPVVQPIKTEADVARGGWIIAAAFSLIKPVPVYMDNRPYQHKERAGVFYRSFERVRTIINGPISKAFPGNKDVAVILAGIEHMINYETDSGSQSFLHESSLNGLSLTGGFLNQDAYNTCISVFNGEPRLSQEGVDLLRNKLRGVLLGVALKAAFLGVQNCFDYMKNAGRELDMMLPSGLNASTEVWLKVCR